jgi:hypothetical protein
MNVGVTSIALVVRAQTLFRAFAVTESLPVLQTDWLDRLELPLHDFGMTFVRARFGKGPINHKLGISATLYFDGSDESYPVFSFPSESPKGSSVRVSSLTYDLVADEKTAIFCLEAAVVVPVAPENWEQASRNEVSQSLRSVVEKALHDTRLVLDILVGAYALYQYPLVWTRIHDRDQYCFINATTKEASPFQQPLLADNFIPFRVDASSQVQDGVFSDAVITKAGELIGAQLKEPLVFLKDSLWHSDIRTRFLLQFWILEYFAEKHSAQLPRDEGMKSLVNALEEMIADRFPEYLQRFTARKGELLRQTLVEKVQACCNDLRIQYDDATFRRAKKVRDNLSHGAQYRDDDLKAMEQFVRELARHILRRELEFRGVFLTGEPIPVADLPVIVPAFIRLQGEQPKTATFAFNNEEMSACPNPHTATQISPE